MHTRVCAQNVRYCSQHDMDALVAQDAQAVAASASDHSKATGGLSESQTKWKEARDGDSGKVYYYNSKTGKTSWDREAQ